MHKMDILSHVTNWAAYFVFFSSLLSNLLAVVESWSAKWFPSSRFTFVVAVSNDLISRFGALNWRDKIAAPVGDRRDTGIITAVPPKP